MKVRYEAIVKVVVTGEIDNEDDLIDNAQAAMDETIEMGIKDGIDEEMDITIDSTLEISK